MTTKIESFRPLRDGIFCEVLPSEEVTPGGIVLTSGMKEKPNRARVLATGPGKYYGDKLIEPSVKRGDIVLFLHHAAQQTGPSRMGGVQAGDRFVITEDKLLGVET